MGAHLLMRTEPAPVSASRQVLIRNRPYRLTQIRYARLPDSDVWRTALDDFHVRGTLDAPRPATVESDHSAHESAFRDSMKDAGSSQAYQRPLSSASSNGSTSTPPTIWSRSSTPESVSSFGSQEGYAPHPLISKMYQSTADLPLYQPSPRHPDLLNAVPRIEQRAAQYAPAGLSGSNSSPPPVPPKLPLGETLSHAGPPVPPKIPLEGSVAQAGPPIPPKIPLSAAVAMRESYPLQANSPQFQAARPVRRFTGADYQAHGIINEGPNPVAGGRLPVKSSYPAFTGPSVAHGPAATQAGFQASGAQQPIRKFTSADYQPHGRVNEGRNWVSAAVVSEPRSRLSRFLAKLGMG